MKRMLFLYTVGGQRFSVKRNEKKILKIETKNKKNDAREREGPFRGQVPEYNQRQEVWLYLPALMVAQSQCTSPCSGQRQRALYKSLGQPPLPK